MKAKAQSTEFLKAYRNTNAFKYLAHTFHSLNCLNSSMQGAGFTAIDAT